MTSVENDVAILRTRLEKVEAELVRERKQSWRRLAIVTLLLLAASIHPALSLFLGALLLGGSAIVSLLLWMNESVNGIGHPRSGTAKADQAPPVDAPAS